MDDVMDDIDRRIALSTLPAIKFEVAREFGVREGRIAAIRTDRGAARARWVCMFLAWRHLGLSPDDVARHMGAGAPSTVHKSTARIAALRRDPDCAARIQKLIDFTAGALARAKRFAACARPPKDGPPQTAAMPKAPRPCLRCHKPFVSDGPFNRICPTCARINAEVDDGASRTIGGMA